MQLMLKYRANINKSCLDRTALSAAASERHKTIIQILLEKGGNVIRDHANLTVLFMMFFWPVVGLNLVMNRIKARIVKLFLHFLAYLSVSNATCM